MDGTKRQNWIKQRERKKKATHTKKTKSPIHSKTQPEVADSTKKKSLPEHWTKYIPKLLFVPKQFPASLLKIAIKLHQGLRFHKHSTLHAKKSYS